MSETKAASQPSTPPPAEAGVLELPELTVTGRPVDAKPALTSDEVGLVVGGVTWTNWQEIRITRGIEQVPSDFSFIATEREADPAIMPIAPSAPCRVNILGDLVLTGYVDRYIPSISPRNHQVLVTGRSKLQDLVDSAAIFEDAEGNPVSSQLSAGSAAELARFIAAPHGITVSAPDGNGPTIPPHVAYLTETGFEIIERVARYAKMLAFDDVDGNLVLARVGSRQHSSGAAQGINVERAMATYAWDQRFTEYDVLITNLNNLADVTTAAGGDPGWNRRYRVEDPGSTSKREDGEPRRRRRIIMLDNVMGGEQLAKDRADWDRARRWGRSQVIEVTLDSWRDSNGQLWEPNWLCPVDVPSLKVQNAMWVIVSVTYRRGRRGTQADLVLMPPEAVQPEPSLLLPFDAQVAGALAASSGP